ncbi:MAG: YdeI/OmpD-associated family protein [Gemmatimonadales bacterium]
MVAATRDEVTLAFETPAQWRAWLAEHHVQAASVLLCIPKRSGAALTYSNALDAALAWGWIDSQKRALDASAWLQRFGKRTPKSPWSKINRARAEGLIAAGKMENPGQAEVDRARADGRWDRAYDGARASTVPEDLAAALAKSRKARAFFEALDGANRYAILYRVQTAKKPETRAARIAKLVAMCAAGETIHPPKKPRRLARHQR